MPLAKTPANPAAQPRPESGVCDSAQSVVVQRREHTDFYVYVLYRQDGQPFYVGKGRGGRWEQHEKSYPARARNLHKERLCAKLMLELGHIPKQKLAENLTEPEALALEIKTIAQIGRGKNGPLLNLTIGGEAYPDRTPEAQAKQRTSMLLVHQSPGYKEALKTAIKLARSTPESRALTSARNKERFEDPEEKAKWLKAIGDGAARPEATAKKRGSLIEAYKDPALRARIGAVHKGKRKSATTRAKMSLAQKNRPAATIEKIAASLRGRKRTPEVRLALSKAAKIRWANQDERTRQRERLLGKKHANEAIHNMRVSQQRRRAAERESDHAHPKHAAKSQRPVDHATELQASCSIAEIQCMEAHSRVGIEKPDCWHEAARLPL